MIISRRLRWVGHVARMVEGRSAFKILTGKSVEKRSLGRPRHRWEDNVRINVKRHWHDIMSRSSTNSVLVMAPDVSSHSMFITSVSTFYRNKVKAQWCK